MKKDDKKPNKPKKKPQKKVARKATPKNKGPSLSPKPVDLDALSKEDSLTVGEIVELSKKDKSNLTLFESAQLLSAESSITKAMDSLAGTFSKANKLARIISEIQMPALEAFEELRKAIDNNPTLKAIEDMRHVQTTWLAVIQQDIIAQQGSIAEQFRDIASAATLSHSLFADIQSSHEQYLKAFSINIPSLGVWTKLTATESIRFNLNKVIDNDGYIATESEVLQSNEIDGYILVHKADLRLLFTELKANRQEMAEIKGLIRSGVESGITKIEYADVTFRREVSKLIIKGFDVGVQRASKQAQFCDLFFSSKENFIKKWDIAELMSEAFAQHLNIDGNEDDFVSIVKGYVTALNSKIFAGTKGQVSNFFILLSYEVYINPIYISNL